MSTSPAVTPSFEPNPGQKEASKLLQGPQRHTLIKGGARSGKTFLICRAIAVRAIRGAESRHLITRFRNNAVWPSIGLDTLPKVMKLCFPQVPYSVNKQMGFFRLANRSEIWLGGLDDKERVEKILGQEYCVDPDALVLTSDLRWLPAKSLAAGQELIGFPEDLEGHIKLQPSVIERHEIIRANKFRVVTTHGTTIVSENHQFVALHDDRRHRNFRLLSWRRTKDLRVGDQIRFTTTPWTEGQSREDGWLAGMLDGEGWASKAARQVGVAQCAGKCLDGIKDWFRQNLIAFTEHVSGSKHGKKGPCHQVRAAGLWPSLRLLGIAQPKRLEARNIWEGCRAFTAGGYDAEILAIEPLGVGPVVSMSTTTKTFIADGFLAHNCTVYFNECSQIPYSSVLVARTRLAQTIEGLKQRAYYDLNPSGTGHWTHHEFIQHRDPVSRKSLPSPEQFRHASINPMQNAGNLSAEFLTSLQQLPERQRKRFFDGEYVAEVDGALWTYDLLEKQRIDPGLTPDAVPEMSTIVVSVDPSGASGDEDARSDEIGITVTGKGRDGRGYLLQDGSLRDGPGAWGRRAVDLYHKYKADRIVAEKNFGGEMVRFVIKAADANVPVSVLTAARGKHVRAEPIATLYEQDKIRHVGRFPELEDQLVNFSTAGYVGERSPDRADAMVWGFTNLMLGGQEAKIVAPIVISASRPTPT